MEANNMALREFAEYLANYPTCDGCEGKKDSRFCESCPKGVALAPITLQARMALAAPPRNCEVGSVEEQVERFREFCDDEKGHREHCRNCRLCNAVDCELAWAQMPYEDDEKGEVYDTNG